ncbi:MarR family winged helix-turn-helix transcriptional regulator [Rathayibacter sp. Leaf248]|nr:MarR family transcriptional regulator [Rathayibacter sp. Leaf248]MCJ1695649.1 MarR family transcriptional regulator [Rathayibacter caricis]
MDVKSTHPSSPHPSYVDREDRTAARRDGRAIPAGDLRAYVQQIAVRQQRFERYLGTELNVDRAGLEAMDHLLSVGPATPTELAHQLGISTATMTLVLNRLEAAGHVTRDRHPSDRRKMIVTASSETAARAYGHVAPLIEGVEGVIESLTDPERTIIEAFLTRLIATYDSVTPPIGR